MYLENVETKDILKEKKFTVEVAYSYGEKIVTIKTLANLSDDLFEDLAPILNKHLK
jgi:hypothetical protein